MFHVIDKLTGEIAVARGFWAVDEDGFLFDVEDGWGCEGGGGSSRAPGNCVAVMGPAPVVEAANPVAPAKVAKVYTYRCSCGGRFQTYAASAGHCRDTKQPGLHVITEV